MPLTLLLAAVLANPLSGNSLCDRIAELTQAPAVARAHWGVSVTTLTGTPVCGLNETQYFRPASNAKLFTTAAALTLLGPASTATTRITGPEPVGAMLVGDLTLVGAGDAYLSTRPMPYTRTAPATPPPDPLAAMADALAARGVRRVTGDIVGDDTAFPYEPYAPDWALDDLQWGYGAPVSALTVADNKTALTVRPGTQAGMPASATLNPPDPLTTLNLRVTTVAAGIPAAVRVERAPGSAVVHLLGTVAIGAPYTDDLAIMDPAGFAAATFKAMLIARGIAVDGTARARHAAPEAAESFSHAVSRTLPLPSLPAIADTPVPALASHTSPTLAEDVAVTLKVSQNLHAELLLHRLGRTFADDGSTAQGVRVVSQFLRNAGVIASATNPEVILFDGSGLSGHDLATPAALTRVLVYAARQGWGAGFRAALPVGGVDGSLAGRFPALKGRVQAKTGTLGESRALSGYVTTAGGQTLVFSVLVDNHAPGGNADRAAMDRIVEAIAAAP